jgi:flagellar biosynthesis anti-sigma factor FlgM
MKVNDPNASSLASAEAARSPAAARAATAGATTQDARDKGAAPGDDVHLSELVRSLRALANDSPERQAHLEELARAYASGAYKVDAEATAGRIIDDALRG